MGSRKTPKPTGDHIMEQFQALRPLANIVGLFSPNIREKFRDVEQQFESVQQMIGNRDRFAAVY